MGSDHLKSFVEEKMENQLEKQMEEIVLAR